MIKLIATDLDGTLFYPKRRLTLTTKANKEFLRDFYKAGGKVVLVTGRSFHLASKVEKKVGIPISIVGCNGAFVYEDGKFIIENPLDNNSLINFYNEIKNKYGVTVWMVFDNTDKLKITVHVGGKVTKLGARIGNRLQFSYKENFIAGEKKFVDCLTSNVNYKLMPVFGITNISYKRTKDAYIALKAKYSDKFTIVASKNAMEITAPNINKANVLKEYIKMLGINEDEVAVIGDSENDLVMFDGFKNSFVMSHAQDEIKERANTVVDSVSDLRKYLLNDDKTLKE